MPDPSKQPTTQPRIYLDNAATSWPKPEAVYRAVDDYQRKLGAPAGRSSYREAADTERLVSSCRQRVAELIGADDARRIVFTQNCTDSLNQALHGLLRPGDHVVTSVCEHNSILRPLTFLAEHRGVTATYVPCDAQGFINPDDVRRAITPKTRLIALLHASNVTGAIQPIADVGQIAEEHDVPLLVDAAQTLGYLPVNVRGLHCDLLAAPGHKGLLGPLGTGILYVGPRVADRLLPLRQGGTGTRSDEDIQPTSLPDRYESGNLNVLGIVGLEAGVRYVQSVGVDHCQNQARQQVTRLLGGLSGLGGLMLYGPPAGQHRVAVVSLNVAGFAPQELASLLDANWSIQTRAGIHCAPRMHRALGTAPQGTLRLSPGHFTTDQEIDAAIATLGEITAA